MTVVVLTGMMAADSARCMTGPLGSVNVEPTPVLAVAREATDTAV